MEELLKLLDGLKNIFLQPGVIVWLAINGVGSLLFRFNPDNEKKKKYFPLKMIFEAIMLVAFAIVLHFPWALIVILVIPLTSAVTYVNIRIGRICANCGTYNQKLRPQVIRCRECGIEITD